MIKRTFSLLFAASLIVTLLLGACAPVEPAPGGTPTASPAPRATRTAPPAVTSTPDSQLGADAGALRGTQIEFWYPWTGDAAKIIEQQVSQFNSANSWGIRVETRALGNPGYVSDEVQGVLGTPQTPDLVVAYPEQALAWDGGASALVDLTAYVEDSQWGLTPQEVADFPAPIWNLGLAGSQRIGIPAEASALFLAYNVSWARELGFTAPPTTPDEFKQQACAAAAANAQESAVDRKGTGGWIVSTDDLSAAAWMEAFGANLEPSAQGAYSLGTAQTQAAFAYFQALYAQGCAWKALNPEPYDYFSGHQALFYTASLSDLAAQVQANRQANNNDQWTVLPFPSAAGKPAALVYGPAYVLLRTSPERQLAAWLLVKWLIDPQREADLATADGSFPARSSALTGSAGSPQWEAAARLLVDARPTPQAASWVTVRSILSDAFAALFDAQTQAEQIPDMVSQLDQTVKEVLGQAQ